MSLVNRVVVAMTFMLMMMPFAWAQSGTSSTTAKATGTSARTVQDVRFVMAASAAGETEILASRLAQKQGQSQAVKSFAATMLRDHGKANDQLKTIAQKDGYTLSSTPTQAEEVELARLRPLHGKKFDQAYAAMMVKDHREAVALFQSESTSGSNGDLKAFATQTLPILQHHLALATSL